MNRSLLLDLYELTMAEAYLTYKRGGLATFDLFVRKMPRQRKYLIACGLEDILAYIRGLRFNVQDLGYLKKTGLFSKGFLAYLARFKFSGDIWAIPEGTVCFANEPLVRVTAPIIEAQVIESFLLNTINLQTMIASKASRVVCAARDLPVYDFSLRRTHGAEAGLKVARAAFIAGFAGTSNVLAAKLYNIPVAGTMAHSFVMSFRREIDSFLAYAETFPEKTTLLVDTYNTKKGIENAVTIGLYLKEKGHHLLAIRLDSGNIVTLSRLARAMLEKAGLGQVKIFASGNLDELKIKGLLDKGARLDCFGVGTNMGTSIDAPALDVIYKLSEVTDDDGKFLPVMKLSKAKVTYPGRKQVFRAKDRRGRFVKDILGLEKEKINGRPLLIKVVDRGRLIYRPAPTHKIRRFAKDNLSGFCERLRDVSSGYEYPVAISPRLQGLRRRLYHGMGKRQ